MDTQSVISSVGILLIAVFLAIVLLGLLLYFTLRNARKAADKPPAQGEPSDAPGLAARVTAAGGILPSFSRGLSFLRETVTGRNYLYDVPWLMMLAPEGTGTTTVLANAAASASLAREGGRNFGLSGGLEWWFYQRGLVLNPPSATVLRRDGTSDRASWLSLLQVLARRRARRPLDAVILAISVEDLLPQSDGSAHPGDVTFRADVLREKLSQLRRAVSMRMPVYVLVTKCDLIPGFGSFAGELPAGLHSDIFGWSSPYPLEEAFSPDWVDQCCNEMHRRIVEQQMEVFVERSSLSEPDGVFLFPSEFNALRIPLRQHLAQIFNETAYQESYYFRGIYFCGDAEAVAVATAPEPVLAGAAAAGVASRSIEEPGSAETSLVRQSSRPPSFIPTIFPDVEVYRPVFLNHLFELKIFPECRLARPLKVIDMSRNRIVRTARIMTAVFILLATVGTLTAYVRLSGMRRDHLSPLFHQLADDMEHADFRKARVGGETAAERSQRVEHAARDTNSVLRSMTLLSEVRMRFIFLPESWNGVVDHELQRALARAFSTIALNGLRVELSLQLKSLIEKTTPRTMRVAGAPDEGRTSVPMSTELAYESAAVVPEYQGWQDYIAGLRALETNIARYNRIATPGEASTSDLKDLLKYLHLDSDLPPDFDFTNPYFVGMLRQASNQQFEFKSSNDSDVDEDDAVDHAHRLVEGFFSSWFGPKNHLAVSVGSMTDAIAAFPDAGSAVSYQALKDTADSITHVTTDLDSPSFDWLSDGDFDVQRYPAFAQTIADIQYLQDYHLADDLTVFGKGGYRKFVVGLSQKSTRLTGQVLDLDSAPVQISSSVATLQASLRPLLEQVFVAREPGPLKPLDPALPMWDRNTLLEATKLFDAYDKFDRGPLRTTSPYIRNALRRVALSRLQDNVLDYIGQAQGQLVPGSPDGADIKSFTASLDVLQQLLAGFSKFSNLQVAHNFSSVLATQASNLLVSLDRQLKEKNLYAVRDQNFNWWEGEKPLSLAAYDVRSADDLKDYVDREFEEVATMAQQADPLVKFLQQRGSASGREAGQALADWRAIGLEIKKHSEKAPGNSVTLLEDFVRTGMDKIAPDASCQDMTRDPGGRSDYFLAERAQLRSGALERCRILSQRAYTTQIADLFNQRLAGRFPFSATPPQNVLAEADPKAVVDFYAKLDQYGKIATDSLKQNAQYGKSRDAALDFLTNMAQIRPVFATYIAGVEKDPAPSFDFVVRFRVNQGREIEGNQISDWGLDVGQQNFKYRSKENTGKWRLGDPIRVSFRFADDSPLVPVLDPAQPGMNVYKRTVSFEYPGSWSLFRLLLAHRPGIAEFEKGADPAPHTLSFLIPTAPDRTLPQQKDAPVGGQVRVYLQLIVVPPGAKEGIYVPLPFPVAAPALTKN